MNAKLADFSELSKFLSLKVQGGFDLFSFLLWGRGTGVGIC